ncbi:alpha/beta fold hydrolase [uncultured Bosea sp.]|uniref:alpha/beta fold hydrolase n=1 Tax=uncultured Bosea sp. TaxID=211457 RepID=UPI0025CEE8C0|nr:alpha/beta fold hydrolase [uncultured Bosea sp.]
MIRISKPLPARARGLAGLLLSMSLALAGCATMEGMTTSVIAEKRIELVTAGQGAPAVVFENGLGGRLDWWAKVLPEVARETRVFAYNRPGTGTSDTASTPRDGSHVIEELRQNLRETGIAPPYVLVGHSLGGLYMQLYARRYPNEVAGLVLVDSTHPEQMKGAGARENWPTWANIALNALTSDAAKAELAAIPETGAAMLALPPLSGKPVIVLSAKGPMSETSELARDANAKRVDIARLHPGAKQVWVDSGHGIPLERPEAVVAAIRDVLTAARARVASAGQK